jgi:hypothetical protein
MGTFVKYCGKQLQSQLLRRKWLEVHELEARPGKDSGKNLSPKQHLKKN